MTIIRVRCGLSAESTKDKVILGSRSGGSGSLWGSGVWMVWLVYGQADKKSGPNGSLDFILTLTMKENVPKWLVHDKTKGQRA